MKAVLRRLQKFEDPPWLDFSFLSSHATTYRGRRVRILSRRSGYVPSCILSVAPSQTHPAFLSFLSASPFRVPSTSSSGLPSVSVSVPQQARSVFNCGSIYCIRASIIFLFQRPHQFIMLVLMMVFYINGCNPCNINLKRRAFTNIIFIRLNQFLPSF